MLDDLKMIAQRDKSDTLGVAEKQLAQLQTTINLEPVEAEIHNVVFAGMGGSALYADMAKTWLDLAVPYEVVKGYDIPAYVNEHTLFIASSFSGNTEETLTALEQAELAGAQLATISSGGKLTELAKTKGIACAQLDSSIPQPRMAVLGGLKALVTILEAYGLTSGRLAELEQAANNLMGANTNWLPDVPTSKNPAKQLAQELMGRSIVIYAGAKHAPTAYKWKISCNENAKNVAWTNYYSEYNHNEFIGWSSHPVDKPYAIVNLISQFEYPKINTRIEISDRLLSGQRPQPNNVELQGSNLVEEMIWGIMFGDFVSIYLALLNELDPAPVDLVEKLKREL